MKNPVQNGVACHRGVHVFGVPPQPVTPAASKAATVRSWVVKWKDVAYTMPPATAGDCTSEPDGPTAAVQRGTQTFGTPAHPVAPLASNAYSRSPPTNTVPLATTGAVVRPGTEAVHSGRQTFGTPEQSVVPLALYAASIPSSVPTNTAPAATARPLKRTEPLRGAVQSG